MALGAYVAQLQWGRDRKIAESPHDDAMESESTDGLQWGRDRKIAERITAALGAFDVVLLQWGRDRKIAESRKVPSVQVADH